MWARNWPTARLPTGWRGGAMVGRRTCDQEVASSIPGQGAAAWLLWASCSHPVASTLTLFFSI